MVESFKKYFSEEKSAHKESKTFALKRVQILKIYERGRTFSSLFLVLPSFIIHCTLN